MIVWSLSLSFCLSHGSTNASASHEKAPVIFRLHLHCFASSPVFRELSYFHYRQLPRLPQTSIREYRPISLFIASASFHCVQTRPSTPEPLQQNAWQRCFKRFVISYHGNINDPLITTLTPTTLRSSSNNPSPCRLGLLSGPRVPRTQLKSSRTTNKRRKKTLRKPKKPRKHSKSSIPLPASHLPKSSLQTLPLPSHLRSIIP
jgi:hypothetical protein